MSRRGGPASRHPFFWATLAVVGATVGACALTATLAIRDGATRLDPGWTYEWHSGGWFVARVKADSPASGKLQPDDRIVGINGDDRVERTGPYPKLHGVRAGSWYSVEIGSAGQERSIELTMRAESDASAQLWMLSQVFVALACCAFALIIGVLNPADSNTPSGTLGACGAALALMGDISDLSVTPTLFRVAKGLRMVGLPSVLLYHNASNFPARVPESPFWRALKRVVDLIGIATLYHEGTLGLVNALGEPVAMRYYERAAGSRWLPGAPNPWLPFSFPAARVFVLAALVAVIARNYRVLVDQEQRRRLRWIISGSVFGVVPLCLVEAGRFLARAAGIDADLDGLRRVAGLLIAVFPIIAAYAVVKHRILGVDVVVRSGLQYLLAANVLRAVVFLPLAVLVVTIASHPNRTVSETLVGNYWSLILFGSAALTLRYRGRLSTWLDTRFFREAYDQEKLLLELVDGIKGQESVIDISRLVSRRLEDALHPERVYVFYRESAGNDMALGSSSHAVDQVPPAIRPDFELLRRLEFRPATIELPLGATERLPELEENWLQRLGVSLLVPISGGTGRLLGLLLLGAKRSEEPYSGRDRSLLEAVASQIGLVYENVWLAERVREERKFKHEVLGRLAADAVKLMKECPECGRCFDTAEERCPRDGRELIYTTPVERTVNQKYRLEVRIGQGGMGTVYEALDLRLNRKVAFKVMTGSLFGNLAAVRRFEREARAAARLNHRNIVAIYDFGAIAGSGAYLVMELVEGRSLQSELQARGAVSTELAAELLDQLLAGMEAAHSAGVIHRDLKPENVLVAGRGDELTIKILDFGLAKLRAENAAPDSTQTVAGAVLGTLGYMAPEQVVGGAVDERSDIFALGVIVVRMLTGELPFLTGNYAEYMKSVCERDFQLPGDSGENGRLNAVLRKSLTWDPADRFPSVATLRAELVPAIRAHQPRRRQVGSGEDAPTEMA
jgi:hypothetical protein